MIVPRLCIETPSAGSRVLEKGDENSIKLFKHGASSFDLNSQLV
jgi:hypothetical protein